MVNISKQQKRSKRWVFEDEGFIREIVTFGYDDLRSALSLAEHTHRDCFEFVYMEKGRTVWEVGGRMFETKSGDVFTAFPDEVHKGSYDIIEPCRFWWIIVRMPERSKGGAADAGGGAGDVIDGARTQAAGHPDWLRLASDEAHAVLKGLLELPRVVALGSSAVPAFRKLQAAARRQGELDRVEGTLALLDFLLQLIKCGGDRTDETNTTMKRVAEVIAGLPDRLDHNLPVSALAEESGLGTTHFYQLFLEQTGLTPKAYIEHLRIEEASRRLLDTSESITSLSLDLGFATSQHFATVFRRIKGRTPSEWRKQAKAKTL